MFNWQIKNTLNSFSGPGINKDFFIGVRLESKLRDVYEIVNSWKFQTCGKFPYFAKTKKLYKFENFN